jgi:hypothetical protein
MSLAGVLKMIRVGDEPGPVSKVKRQDIILFLFLRRALSPSPLSYNTVLSTKEQVSI